MKNENDFEYSDILNIARPISRKHISMSILDRSAQFAPFAALSGYEDAVREAGKKSEEKTFLFDDDANEIDRRLKILSKNIEFYPEVEIVFFKYNAKRKSGEYITIKGKAESVDENKNIICLKNGTEISIDDIHTIEGEIFE